MLVTAIIRRVQQRSTKSIQAIPMRNSDESDFNLLVRARPNEPLADHFLSARKQRKNTTRSLGSGVVGADARKDKLRHLQ